MQIVGIGNILRGDDGIGPTLIEKFQQDKETSNEHEYIDIAGDAFALLDILAAEGPKLIIDCCEMNEKPGTVKIFDIDGSTLEQHDSMLSLHSMGFSDVYKLALLLNPNPNCRLIAVQPESLEFNGKLSKVLKEKIPYIEKLIKEEIKNYA
ncbi:MAG: hydrogenase maturation protease [Candidatus Marinimicrobia bacterium]|nr:hydrogenase maturation protease [Candidatus Neomarinimicrobiota bacterium]